MKVPSGTVTCFYTDGLIERRHQPLGDCVTRLCGVLAAQDPEAACEAVMEAMVGSEPARDDIAMLTIRRLPEPDGP